MVKNKKAGLMTSKFGKLILVLIVVVVVMVTFFPRILSGVDTILSIVGLGQNICEASGLTSDIYNNNLDIAIHQDAINEAKEIIIEFYGCFEDHFEDLIFMSDRDFAYQIAEELCTQGYFRESKGVFNVIAVTNLENQPSTIDAPLTHGEVREICSELRDIHLEIKEISLHEAASLNLKFKNANIPVWNFVLAESIYSPGIMPKSLFDRYSTSWIESVPYGQEYGIINPTLNLRRISEDRIQNIYYYFITKKVKEYVDSDSSEEFCFETDEWWELFDDTSPESFQEYLNSKFSAFDNQNCEKYTINFWKYEHSQYTKINSDNTQLYHYSKFKCKIRSTWVNYDEPCSVDCEASNNKNSDRFGDETHSSPHCLPSPISEQLTD